jgi:hypothetical protein
MSPFLWCTTLYVSALLTLPLVAGAQTLTVVGVSPTPHATASSTTAIVLTFSQPVLPAVAADLSVAGSYCGRLLGTTTVRGATLTFVPAHAFQPGESITVSLRAATPTGGGPPLASPYVYAFSAAPRGGTALFRADSLATFSAGGYPDGVAAGDVDGDSDLDLVAISRYDQLASVLLNTGTGQFVAGSTFPLTGGPRWLKLGDLDGDGDVDVVTSNADGTVSTRLNDGRGNFAGGNDKVVSFSTTGLALGDVDGDGDLDPVTLAPFGVATLLVNDGQGVLTVGAQVALASNFASGVAVADLDNDGDLDLWAADETRQGQVCLSFNNGRGSFGRRAFIAVEPWPASVTPADVNGDGNVDMVVPSEDVFTGVSLVSIRLNTGQGGFSTSQTVAVGARPTSVISGDLDGDGDVDLLAVNSNGNTLSVLLNDGQGHFVAGTAAAVGTLPTSAALADLDGDGDLDVASSCGLFPGSCTVRLNGPAPVRLVSGTSPLQVWPNPAHALVRVQIPADCPQLIVSDLLGRTVLTVAVPQPGEVPLSVESLRPGRYILRAGAWRNSLLVEK